MTTAVKGPVVTATVKDGRMNLTERQRDTINTFLASWEGKVVQANFAPYKRSRTSQQNKLLWGVHYAMIADHTGHAPEEIHLALKDMFLPRKFLKLGAKEVEIRKTTTDLTVSEFQEYLHRIEAWASTELGIAIPMDV